MVTTKDTIFTDEEFEYELIDQIGKGGFGAVWLAQRKGDTKKYAIKTLLSDFSNEEELASLTNEIMMAMQVNSPNVIKYMYCHDGRKFPGLPPYIIMEYADNGSLSDLLKSRKELKQLFSNDDLSKLYFQLANGMAAINTTLIHRDIKPDNILLHQGILKITDFGLSKLASEQTRTMSFKGYGTPRYISPEAWIPNNKNTKQMDIYSMGIVFYELATLSYPYDISNDREYFSACQDAHTYGIPKDIRLLNSGINPVISSIVMKMLNKRTDKRYKEWSEILTALSNLNMPSVSDSSIVDNLLNIQLKRDNAKIAEENSKEKRMHEIDTFCKKISYQYEHEIMAPLITLVDEFNIKSQSGKIEVTYLTHSFKTVIRVPSGKRIEIRVKPILEEDFVRERRVNEWGQFVRDDYNGHYNDSPFGNRTISRVEIPNYKNNKILAWGGLYADSGQGYNLLLIEQKDNSYGKWLFILNTNSGLSREHRLPQPFAFELDELEQEVPRMSMMNKFNSDEYEFSETMLFQFLLNNF